MEQNADSGILTEEEVLEQIRANPEDADALLRLGWWRLTQKRYAEALELLLKAHVLQPASAIVRIYAARALAEFGDLRSRQMIRDWADWLPLPDQQQYDLAEMMQRTDWTAEAIGVLEDLLRRSPKVVVARQLLAELYERVNRLDESRALMHVLDAEISQDDSVERRDIAHLQATLLRRAGDAAGARAILERVGPRFEDDGDHEFALAALADRMGDTDAAMRHLTAAHAIRVKHLEQVAPNRLRDDIALIPTAQRSLDAESLAKWPTLISPDAAGSPVFVVGFPRSGTTLLEQMLDSHPALQAMDERPHFDILGLDLEEHGFVLPNDIYKLTQPECDELRKGYLIMACEKVKRQWHKRLVDKNPLNMLELPLIHRLYPQAKFILMLRHPCDVLLSNYMQDYRSFVLASVSRDLAHLARSYVEAFTHWLHHVALLQPSVLTVHYEDLVADQAGTAARIADYLGLEAGESMLNAAQHARQKGFISTPSYRQVIEPVNRRAIGRWEPYRAWFAEVLPVLAPMAERLGYTIDVPK